MGLQNTLFIPEKIKNIERIKRKVVAKWLAGLLINSFQTQLPIDYRFLNTESKQSVWSEQATTPLKGIQTLTLVVHQSPVLWRFFYS